MTNKIIGYKAFNNMKDRYNNIYEVGKSYHIDGIIKWKENGFHFCKNLEDVFRYYDGFDQNINICQIEGYGSIISFFDDYAEYYDMYAASDIKIIKELSREEILNEVLSKNYFSIIRLISGYKLTEEEIKKIKTCTENPLINSYIDYYQKNDKKAFQRRK